MQRNYIIEILLVLLAVAAVVTIIKYPRQILVNLPLEILKHPFKRLWHRIITPFEMFPGLLNRRTWRKVKKMENRLDVRIKDEDDIGEQK